MDSTTIEEIVGIAWRLAFVFASEQRVSRYHSLKSTLIRPVDADEHETVLEHMWKLISHGFQLRYFQWHYFPYYSIPIICAFHPLCFECYDPSHYINVIWNRLGLDIRSHQPSGSCVITRSLLLKEDFRELETSNPLKLRGGCYNSPAEVQTLYHHGKLLPPIPTSDT